MDTYQQLLKDLLQNYKEVMGEHPDEMVRDFREFLHAKKSGGIGIDPFMSSAYVEFAKRNNLAEKNLLQANPLVLLLLRGIQDFVAQSQYHLEQKHDYFFQQTALLLMGLETAARPAVEIFQVQTSSPKKFVQQIEFEPYSRFVQVKKHKHRECGHLGSQKFYFHPSLSASLLPTNQSDQLKLEFTYQGTELPKEFLPVSAFFYTTDREVSYRILWLLSQSRIEGGAEFHLPVYNFGYPRDLVNEPYQYAWRYLSPYPLVLDFLFEISGLQPEHFRKEEENCWKANYLIHTPRSMEDIESWVSYFSINTFPLFYWHQGESYVLSKKLDQIRIYEDARRAIWIRVGKGNQQLATPLFYVDESGEGTGWIAQKGGEIFLNVLPFHKERNPGEKRNIGVHSIFAGLPVESEDELQVREDKMSTRERASIRMRRIVSCQKLESAALQQRWNWSQQDKKSETHFWSTLSQTLRQPQSDVFISDLLQRFLLGRLQQQSPPEWLEISCQSRSLVFSQKIKSLVPATLLAVQIDQAYLEQREQDQEALIGLIYCALARFHPYMQERLPPNIFLQMELYLNTRQRQVLLASWS